MESITRNVRDLAGNERSVLERLLGHGLNENQQLLIQVTTEGQTGADPRLPDWCNVYKGLSDDEIDAVEETILQRARLTRSFE